MKPAEGVIIMRPEIAPMKHESKLQRPTSMYVYNIHVNAPLAAQRFVTHRAMTNLKLKARVVPTSKASHEPRMLIMARSRQSELTGSWMTRCGGVRVEGLWERNRG
jgi:hypothetical protein